MKPTENWWFTILFACSCCCCCCLSWRCKKTFITKREKVRSQISERKAWKQRVKRQAFPTGALPNQIGSCEYKRLHGLRWKLYLLFSYRGIIYSSFLSDINSIELLCAEFTQDKSSAETFFQIPFQAVFETEWSKSSDVGPVDLNLIPEILFD